MVDENKKSLKVSIMLRHTKTLSQSLHLKNNLNVPQNPNILLMFSFENSDFNKS